MHYLLMFIIFSMYCAEQVAENDLFEKSYRGDPWTWCKTRKMAAFLIGHGVPVFDEQRNISAVNAAITHNCDIAYIRYLLKLCPAAANGFLDDLPIFNAGCKHHLLIKNELKKDLLKLLLDYGADPYKQQLLSDNMQNVLQRLQWDNPSLAVWIQQYYHLRKDYIPLKCAIYCALLRSKLSPELAQKVAQMTIFGEQLYLSNLNYQEHHYSVPKAYEELRNKTLKLPKSLPPPEESPVHYGAQKYYRRGRADF